MIDENVLKNVCIRALGTVFRASDLITLVDSGASDFLSACFEAHQTIRIHDAYLNLDDHPEALPWFLHGLAIGQGSSWRSYGLQTRQRVFAWTCGKNDEHMYFWRALSTSEIIQRIKAR